MIYKLGWGSYDMSEEYFFDVTCHSIEEFKTICDEMMREAAANLLDGKSLAYPENQGLYSSIGYLDLIMEVAELLPLRYPGIKRVELPEVNYAHGFSIGRHEEPYEKEALVVVFGENLYNKIAEHNRKVAKRP